MSSMYEMVLGSPRRMLSMSLLNELGAPMDPKHDTLNWNWPRPGMVNAVYFRLSLLKFC